MQKICRGIYIRQCTNDSEDEHKTKAAETRGLKKQQVVRPYDY